MNNWQLIMIYDWVFHLNQQKNVSNMALTSFYPPEHGTVQSFSVLTRLHNETGVFRWKNGQKQRVHIPSEIFIITLTTLERNCINIDSSYAD